MNTLLLFVYLQLLDVLTTVAFLMNGTKEANPLVRFLLHAGPSPLAGLLMIKIIAVLLALYCVRRARLRLLSRVNVFFAALVTWNLFVLIVTHPALTSLT